MEIINQHLGTIGDVHVSIEGGKLVLGADAGVDIVGLLEKLRGGHKEDLLGKALDLVEGVVKGAAPAPQA